MFSSPLLFHNPWLWTKVNEKLMCSFQLTASPSTVLSHNYQNMVDTFSFHTGKKKKAFNSMVPKMFDSLISKAGESQIFSVTALTLARKKKRKKIIHCSFLFDAGFSVLGSYSLCISSHFSSHTLPPTFLFPKQHGASYRLIRHAKKNRSVLNQAASIFTNFRIKSPLLAFTVQVKLFIWTIANTNGNSDRRKKTEMHLSGVGPVCNEFR